MTGVDELLGELLGRRRMSRSGRVVLTLPPTALAEDTARRCAVGIARSSARRLEQVEREAQMLWRQGLRSLRGGTAPDGQL